MKYLTRRSAVVTIAAAAAVALFSATAVVAQTGAKSKPSSNAAATSAATAAKSSPAYAEVLLRKTELEATLEELSVEYTDEYPKLKQTRHEFVLIGQQLERLTAIADAARLTLALGKLIVRKAELDTDLWVLLQKYGDEHEDVKRAKRKAATFEKAIKEILP